MINRHSLINGDIESTIDGEYVKYAEHSAVVDALRAELARVREDAARWYYVKEHSCKYDSAGNAMESWSTHNSPSDFEAVIDAALAAGKGEGEK